MANEKHDIESVNDIKLLVNTFYDKVRNDNLLSPVFNERIKDKWPQHLEKMYTFWETVLLEKRTYFGRPFPPHANLPVQHIHFEKWLQLFSTTIAELFNGEKANEAKWRANKMAEMFEVKIDYYKKQTIKPLL
ncbi:MAG: group III truncated hemoglobin [Parafilimonas sp.]